MQDQLGTYEKDMEAVSSFLLVYDSKKDEQQKLLRENQKKELALLEEQKAVRGQMQKLTEQLSENSVQIEKTENKKICY